eukprot:620261-Lingulodinium_polyedra.AAC.1
MYEAWPRARNAGARGGTRSHPHVAVPRGAGGAADPAGGCGGWRCCGPGRLGARRVAGGRRALSQG